MFFEYSTVLCLRYNICILENGAKKAQTSEGRRSGWFRTYIGDQMERPTWGNSYPSYTRFFYEMDMDFYAWPNKDATYVEQKVF